MDDYTVDPVKIATIREAMYSDDYEPFFAFMASDGPHGLRACLNDPTIYAVFEAWEWDRHRGNKEAGRRFKRIFREMVRPPEKPKRGRKKDKSN